MSTNVTSFRLRELFPIGSGGMGTTFLACVSAAGQFERLVVVKRLHEHLLHDVQARQRLFEEAQLAGYVHHANVVGVQHVGQDERGVFLILDFVDGASLKRLIRVSSPNKIPLGITLRIILDCLAGLEAIHSTTDNQGNSLGILHRDVTPENILIGLDGIARLSDFGIAKSRRSEVQTAPLQLVGKLPFMSPEYIDRGDVGPPLDLYAVGVSLWGLLVGHPPWADLEEAPLLVRILTEGVPPLPPEAEIGERLTAIVTRACASDPTERYASAREMAQDLEELRPDYPIASHGEVRSYIREMIGEESGSLRQRVAYLLENPSSPPPAPEALESVSLPRPPPPFKLPPPPIPPPRLTQAPSTAPSPASPLPPPPEREENGSRERALAAWSICISGIFLGLSVYLLLQQPPDTPAPQVAQIREEAPSAPRETAPDVVPAALALAPLDAPMEAPPAEEKAQEQKPSGQGKPRATEARPNSSGASSPSPSPASRNSQLAPVPLQQVTHTPPPPASAAPPTSLEIVTRNPYQTQ